MLSSKIANLKVGATIHFRNRSGLVHKTKKEKLDMPMEKIAETQVPIHELMRRRWSPRAFLDLPIEPEKLLSMFEAARWAASSNNEQP
jgi:Nitroreductase family